MRKRINHLSLGLLYESYFVCNTQTEPFARKLAEYLAENHNFKVGIFTYDRDALTPNVKKVLKYCYSVLFMLTDGVVEESALDTSKPFYQVYSFVEKENPNATSLMAMDNCQVDYSTKFPEGMKSFYYLHQKNFSTTTDPEVTAGFICKELRKNYSKKEQKILNEFPSNGYWLHEKMFKFFGISTLCVLVSCICGWVLYFESQSFSNGGFYQLLLLLGAFAGIIVAIIMSIVTIAKSLFERIMIFDASEIFQDFKRTTMVRVMCILTTIALASIAKTAFNASERTIIAIFPPALLLTLGVMTLHYFLLSRARNNTALYIDFTPKRAKLDMIFVPIYAVIVIAYIIVI